MSRTLDMQIATEIMGLEVLKTTGSWDELDSYKIQGHDFYIDGDRYQANLPAYSSDMNAAMEVIERLESEYEIIISHQTTTDAKGLSHKYAVQFMLRNSTSPYDAWDSYSNSVPEAICKASLAAVKERSK